MTESEAIDMLASMKKVRLVLMVDEEVRDILRTEHGLTGEDMSDIVAGLIRQHLADSRRALRERKAKDAKRKSETN